MPTRVRVGQADAGRRGVTFERRREIALRCRAGKSVIPGRRQPLSPDEGALAFYFSSSCKGQILPVLPELPGDVPATFFVS
jgi:hypothetical protein